MREELGSRNNKTVDMDSLQRLVYISIKKQYYCVVYILFESWEATLSNTPCFILRWFLYVEIFIKYNTSGKHVNSFVCHCIWPVVCAFMEQDVLQFVNIPKCVYAWYYNTYLNWCSYWGFMAHPHTVFSHTTAIWAIGLWKHHILFWSVKLSRVPPS